MSRWKALDNRRSKVDRQTIDYGIDLGTTNSAIALVAPGAQPEIIASNDNERITPSVVGVSRNGRLRVGRRAYNMTVAASREEQQNVAKEFKLDMGVDERTEFSRLQRSWRPEDLSAEVLKELRASVQRKRGEVIDAGVVTVPAAFMQPQIAATKRAAELAGFAHCELIMEPVAAALAYGYLDSEAEGYWIVYDLGGGTFDVALLQLSDGMARVANHCGDNNLGGRDIDNLILDRILLPAIDDQFDLGDFTRGNEKWRHAIAHVRGLAEQAKIELSRADAAEIYMDTEIRDLDGEATRISGFEYELSRSEVEPLLESVAARTVNMVRDLVSESHLSTQAIEKMILVGGPTQHSLFRDALTSEFGIPLEHTIDPMTVVGQGAAVFAATRKRPSSGQPNKPKAGAFSIALEYDPSGSDAQPDIGGIVGVPAGADPTAYSIELINTATEWRSGKLPLAQNGAFLVAVAAVSGANSFQIELTDAAGSLVPTSPETVGYTQTTIEAPQKTLTHSIYIALPDGSGRLLFKKGESLPAAVSRLAAKADHLIQQHSDDSLRIKIYEGHNAQRVTHDVLIGEVEVPATKFPRELLAGAEIEVTIELDENGQISGEAEVMMFNQDEPYPFDWHTDGVYGSVDEGKLRHEAKMVQGRLAKLAPLASRDSLAADVFQRIEAEDAQEQMQEALQAAKAERGQARKCQDIVMRLNEQLDQIVAKRERPELEQRLHAALQRAEALAAADASGEGAERLTELRLEAVRALSDPDAQLLVQATQRLYRFAMTIQSQHVEFWVEGLQFAAAHKAEMLDQQKAEKLLQQGRRAMSPEHQDLDSLQAAVCQLMRLLPRERQQEAEDTGNVWA